MAVQPRWLNNLLQLLAPALLISHIRQELKWNQPVEHFHLHSTSYLDGLRGLAALFVFGQHYTDYNLKPLHEWYFPPPSSSSLSSAPSPSSSPLQLPYIRLLCGAPSTHVFFVISGFALALRPLRELRRFGFAGSGSGSGSRGRSAGADRAARGRCGALLASAAIRRPVRLWAPCAALTLPLAFLTRWTWRFEHYIAYQPTQWDQVYDWYEDFTGRIAVWPWGIFGNGGGGGGGGGGNLPRPRYNVHLWTIPVELAHSYMLFLVILVLARLRSRLRIAAMVVIMISALRCGKWTAFEFVGGCLLADLNLLQTGPRDMLSSYASADGYSHPEVWWRFLAELVPVLGLLASGFIMSWPTYIAEIPYPYTALVQHAPSSSEGGEEPQFWFALAALTTVWSVGQIPSLRRILERSLLQYLGRVSFVFYIIQHPFLNLFQSRVMGEEPQAGYTLDGAEFEAVASWGLKGWPGTHTGTRLTFTWLLGWAIMVPLELLIADYLTRFVDWPCGRAARSIERAICDDAGGYGDVGHDIEKRLDMVS